jgi:hypothetical protein
MVATFICMQAYCSARLLKRGSRGADLAMLSASLISPYPCHRRPCLKAVAADVTRSSKLLFAVSGPPILSSSMSSEWRSATTSSGTSYTWHNVFIFEKPILVLPFSQRER